MSPLRFLTRAIAIATCLLCITACNVMECGPLTKAPSEYNLAGVYLPDTGSDEKLLAMGFNSSPKFIIDENRELIIENMPVVWRDWARSRYAPIEYDHATGRVKIHPHSFGDSNDWWLLVMDLDEINGDTNKKSTYAGAELCENQGELIFRIPYRGGDIRNFLVFGRFKKLAAT